MRSLVLVAVLAFAGCATPGGQALKACEVGGLAGTLQSVALTVLEVAQNPNSYVSDLEGMGKSLAPGQLSCVAQAVLAWLENREPAPATAPPVSQALLAAHSDVAREHARQVLRQYLNAHPSACGERVTM
jgi:hypothetical protein